jgi:hypothetical protein
MLAQSRYAAAALFVEMFSLVARGYSFSPRQSGSFGRLVIVQRASSCRLLIDANGVCFPLGMSARTRSYPIDNLRFRCRKKGCWGA